MDQATSYRALMHTKLESNEDYEYNFLRFWKRDRQNENTIKARRLPHILNYVVWKKSMFIRYFLECILYIFQVLFLTYFVANFNHDMHTMEKDFISLLEIRIKAQNNTTPEIQEEIEVASEKLSDNIISGVD